MKIDDFSCVVVGAGIIGANIAYYLSKKYPEKKIAVLDKNLAGTGATFYSIGLDFPFGQTEEKKRLSSTSRKLYNELIQEIPEIPIIPVDFFCITEKSNCEAALATSFDGLRIANQQEIDALKKSFPSLALSSEKVVLAGTNARYSKTYAVLDCMLNEYCKNENSYLLETVELESIKVQEDHIELRTNFGPIKTKNLINAMGPWQKGNKETKEYNKQIRTKKIVCFNLENFKETAQAPILYFIDEDAFILPYHSRNKYVLSITSKQWDVRPGPEELKITKDDQQIANTIMDEYFPDDNFDIIGGRVFCDTYTTNYTPLIQKDANYNNILYANGGSGSGFRLAPAIAMDAINLLDLNSSKEQGLNKKTTLPNNLINT